MSTPSNAATSADTPLDREASYQSYLSALLRGDRRQCRACFEHWLAATPDLRTVYEDLVQRALYAVGEQWEQGKVSVATEHLATAISEGLLNLSYPRLFASPRKGLTAVVASTASEQHQLGAKMVADLLELHGWRAHFLGANTPQPDLLDLLRQVNADAVVLSLTVYFNLPALLQTASAIRAEFPDLPILVGGKAFRWGGRERVEQIAGVRCLASLADLEAWFESGHAHAH